MKIYKFYKVPPEGTNYEGLAIQDKYPLYAFTNQKNTRDKFIESRKKDMFIEIVTKVSKDDYVDFANHNNGCLLGEYEYVHCDRKESGKTFNTFNVTIISTWMEKETTNSYLEEGFSAGSITGTDDMFIFPFIFNKKYIDALGVLAYISYWKITIYDDWYNHLIDPEYMDDFMGYDYPDIIYDEFGMFISLYSDTFK